MSESAFEEEARLAEAMRLREQNELNIYRKDNLGKIAGALVDFKVWCRCLGYDPYSDTLKLLKEYFNNGNNAYKAESHKLFVLSGVNSEKTVRANKNLMWELMRSGE